MRLQEIDGFVEGLFNGEADIELPEKASVSLGIIGELRAILAGLHALALDETKAGSDQEFVATLKQIQAVTPIIEREIHVVVLAFTRARRQTLLAQDFSGRWFTKLSRGPVHRRIAPHHAYLRFYRSRHQVIHNK